MQRYPHGPKSDWQEQAERIVSGEIPTSLNDMPALLEWLQDMNWPGAQTIAEHLPTYGTGLSGHVEKVLESGDMIWIGGVLAALADSFDARFWQPLSAGLRRVAYGKDDESADAQALYILARHKLDTREMLRAGVDDAKRQSWADTDDYIRVEELLAQSR